MAKAVEFEEEELEEVIYTLPCITFGKTVGR